MRPNRRMRDKHRRGLIAQLWDSFWHRVENRRQRELRARHRARNPYPVGQWSRWYKANRLAQMRYGRNLRREWIR